MKELDSFEQDVLATIDQLPSEQAGQAQRSREHLALLMSAVRSRRVKDWSLTRDYVEEGFSWRVTSYTPGLTEKLDAIVAELET